MKIRFWGVRGSIPSPGAQTVRYGGNTTCIEVRTDAGALIVLDAGTGLFALAQSLLKELPIEANIFITHTHWDHIQGLPFFSPLYIPGNAVRIFGAQDVVTGAGIERAMEVQLQYSYFPVREVEMRAKIEYENLQVGASVRIGDAMVTNSILNHPVVNLGYRIDCNGKSVFFTGDHEPYFNIYEPGDKDFNEYQMLIEEKQRMVDDAVRGVDLLIADCSYTDAEYQDKRGWGHGTFSASIAFARRCGARQLICTHHEPTRADDDLERAFDEALSHCSLGPNDPVVSLAREGMEIEI